MGKKKALGRFCSHAPSVLPDRKKQHRQDGSCTPLVKETLTARFRLDKAADFAYNKAKISGELVSQAERK